MEEKKKSTMRWILEWAGQRKWIMYGVSYLEWAK